MSVGRAATKARKILSDPGIACFVGSRMSDEALLAFRDKLRKYFPEIAPDRLFHSLAYLSRGELSLEALHCAVWRLAVNRMTLRHSPLAPWRGQAAMEWADGIVESVETIHASKPPRLVLAVRVLTGTAAGVLARRPFLATAIFPLSLRLGFPRRGSGRIAHRRELLGLQCHVELLPVQGTGQELRYSQLMARPGQIAQNRRLLRARLRELAKPRPIWQCPKGFSAASVPCWNCRFGRDVCPVAVRDVSSVRRSV